MADSTANLGLPYPESSDPNNTPADIQALAEELDDVIPAGLAGKVPTSRSVAAGAGLTGGGALTTNRTLAVDFAASGVSSSTKAVRADDSRLVARGGKAVHRLIQNNFSQPTNQTAYGVMNNTTERTAVTGSVVKGIAGSRLLVSVHASGELTSGAAQLIYLGLRITPSGGAAVDYDVARYRFPAGIIRAQFNGTREITGLAAGTYEIEPIFKGSTANVFTFFTDDMVSWSAIELD